MKPNERKTQKIKEKLQKSQTKRGRKYKGKQMGNLKSTII